MICRAIRDEAKTSYTHLFSHRRRPSCCCWWWCVFVITLLDAGDGEQVDVLSLSGALLSFLSRSARKSNGRRHAASGVYSLRSASSSPVSVGSWEMQGDICAGAGLVWILADRRCLPLWPRCPPGKQLYRDWIGLSSVYVPANTV